MRAKTGFTQPLRGRAGFTLIEILLVASLVLAVSVSLASSFLQGIQVYDRLQQINAEEDTLFFIEKITSDIKNCTDSSFIPFSGRRDSVSFAVLTSESNDDSSIFNAYPVEVSYAFDITKRQVVRTESQEPFGTGKPKREVVLTGVQYFDLQYGDYTLAVPSRLSVEIGRTVDTSQNIQKDILIPAGHVSTYRA